MRKTIVSLVTIIMLMAVGVLHAQEDVPSDVTDAAWVLTELNGEVPLYEATLTYVDGNFAGTTGCNNYIVPVSFSDDTLEIATGPITLMACPEPGQTEQEQAFLLALQNVTTYTVSATSLTFFDADGMVVMVFESELNPLMRADWVLASLQGAPVADDTTITADFDASGVGGFAGCNNYAAVYTLEDTALTFSPPVSTLAFCQPDNVMDQEASYLSALETVASFSIVDNQLVLEDADGEAVLVYDAAGNVNLDGTEWTLVSVDGEASMSTPPINLVFEDGNAAGFAGCNRYFGSATVAVGTISFGPLATTRMMCPDDTMTAETAYLEALQGATNFVINGDQLVISSATTELVFTMGAEADMDSVMVEVTYRERIALPPTAEITVQLQDVSLADAPATVLATETFSAGDGSVPFSVELSYDPTAIDDRNTYVVRAEIREDGELIFTTDEAVRVITGDNPNSVTITLVSVSQ